MPYDLATRIVGYVKHLTARPIFGDEDEKPVKDEERKLYAWRPAKRVPAHLQEVHHPELEDVKVRRLYPQLVQDLPPFQPKYPKPAGEHERRDKAVGQVVLETVAVAPALILSRSAVKHELDEKSQTTEEKTPF